MLQLPCQKNAGFTLYSRGNTFNLIKENKHFSGKYLN